MLPFEDPSRHDQEGQRSMNHDERLLEKKSTFKRFYDFFRIINCKFGYKFLTICFCVYGLSQGLGEGWYYPAQSYYFLDALKISAIKANSYSTITHLPWTIKPIYGALSDCVPILGYHRTFYIIFAAALGTIFSSDRVL